MVTLIDSIGTGHEVGKGPNRKHSTCGRPRQDGESGPLDDLPEIVGRRDVTEYALLRQVMFRIAGFPQVADHVVRMDVDGHSGKKDEGSDDKLRRR